MGAGAISLPDRGYLGEIGFNYLPAEPQTPRSPHPPDNFCQILLGRQEALDGEGQWSRGKRLRRGKSSGVTSGAAQNETFKTQDITLELWLVLLPG